jgi:outer membrane protein assembly factor BamB
MNTTDPENAIGDTEVEITDLDAPKTGTIPGSYTRRGQVPSLLERIWMNLAVIAGIALLVILVLGNVLHTSESAQEAKATISATHPRFLSVADGIAYASSPDGTVMALRASDGFLLWRHEGQTAVEVSTTVVDGVVFLALQTFENDVRAVKVDALRTSDGSLLWSRTLPSASSPLAQLTIVNGIVYAMSAVEGLDALRASDGSLLWHYTPRSPFVLTLSVADGVVYAGTQDGHMDALRASDGFPLWQYTSLIPPSSVPPVVADGLILITLQDGSMTALRASNGALLWHRTMNRE